MYVYICCIRIKHEAFLTSTAQAFSNSREQSDRRTSRANVTTYIPGVLNSMTFPYTTTNIAQFISPFSLVTAYFAIPGVAEITPPRFLAAFIIIFLAVGLVFLVSKRFMFRQQNKQTLDPPVIPEQLQDATSDHSTSRRKCRLLPWRQEASLEDEMSNGGRGSDNSWKPKRIWTLLGIKKDSLNNRV
jgi:hypothetical protein